MLFLALEATTLCLAFDTKKKEIQRSVRIVESSASCSVPFRFFFPFPYPLLRFLLQSPRFDELLGCKFGVLFVVLLWVDKETDSCLVFGWKTVVVFSFPALPI